MKGQEEMTHSRNFSSDGNDDAIETESMGAKCKCGETQFGKWADYEDDIVCTVCASDWGGLQRPSLSSLEHESPGVRNSCKVHFCRMHPRVSRKGKGLPGVSGKAKRALDWLSGGHLEGGRPVPTHCGRDQFVRVRNVRKATNAPFCKTASVAGGALVVGCPYARTVYSRGRMHSHANTQARAHASTHTRIGASAATHMCASTSAQALHARSQARTFGRHATRRCVSAQV